MKRATAQVAREIADCLKRYPAIPPAELSFYVRRSDLQKWLLLLAPPKKKRPRDVPRATKGTKDRRAMVRELDDLCREITMARDRNKCRRCGRAERVQWCHCHTRSTHNTRWDLSNVFALCGGCHAFWWHKHPVEATAWWKREIGPKEYGALALRAGKGRRAPNYVAVKDYLLKEKARLA